MMVKRMFVIAGASLLLLFVFWGMFLNTKDDLFFTLGIVAMTICYHFSIRLVIGNIFEYKLRNCVDYKRKWFAERGFEKKLYKNLRVKKWKKYIPTADEGLFSFEKRTPKQIVMSGCQAEIVHEVCAGAGLLAMLLAFPFGEFWVFFATSILAALCDLVFVILQRYNRPRLLKIMEKTKEKSRNKA